MPRLPPTELSFPWRLSDVCPCGSGRTLEKCCLADDGQLYLKVDSTRPPGPQTGYSHPRCFAGCTKDCSKTISREHYISKNILERFDNLKISGMPFQHPGASMFVSADALVANILCQRHNNALSPLDAVAGRAFDVIDQAAQHAQKLDADNRSRFYLISGDGLERWALKTLLGVFFAKIAAIESKPIVKSHSVVVEPLVGRLFSDDTLAPPNGLYIHAAVGDEIRADFKFAPITPMNGAPKLSGLRLVFSGLTIDLFVDFSGTGPAQRNLAPYYRPTVIDLNHPLRTSRIIATWKERGQTARGVALETGSG